MSSSAATENILKTLNDHLSKTGGLDTAEYLTQNAIARELFSRAAPKFLQSKSLATLIEITQAAHATVSQVSAGASLSVSYKNIDGKCGLFIALTDRPFIINSINEVLNETDAKISAWFHPVLLENGVRVSLSYIELDSLPNESLSLLCSKLENTLATLILATDDYSAMLVRTETLARLLAQSEQSIAFAQHEKSSVSEFLRWLCDGGFVFLGYKELTASSGAIPSEGAHLGISKSESYFRSLLDQELRDDYLALLDRDHLSQVTKLRTFSPVHRRARLMHITVREPTADSSKVKLHSLVGILTSKALSEESSQMPLIRQKLTKVLEIESALEGSHDFKCIVSAIDHMPKEDALRLTTEDLHRCVRAALSLNNSREVTVAVCIDDLKRGATLLVAMPRDRFTFEVRRQIQGFLEKSFSAPAGSSEYNLDLSRRSVANLYLYVPLDENAIFSIDPQNFENEIRALTCSWADKLQAHILEHWPERGDFLQMKYGLSFGGDYQASVSIEEAIRDIELLESLSAERTVVVRIANCKDEAFDRFFVILCRNDEELTLSKALPILENAGLEIISESSFAVRPRNAEQLHIQRFLVSKKFSPLGAREDWGECLRSGLEDIVSNFCANDALNGLLISAGLSTRSIAVIRTYAGLLWQLRSFPSRESIDNAIVSQPLLSRLFWEAFVELFDPAGTKSLSERREAFKKNRERYLEQLRSVSDVHSDRVMRALLSLLEATLRTNFFLGQAHVAIKINSEVVNWMPNPRPKFEIFLTGPEVDGTHLRGDTVARGGIRWSERKHDYRSEVLGLMKTQKIKNALIVPSGAKGGFIVKRPPLDPKAMPAAVESAYRTYIRTLLSLADNRVKDSVEHPKDIICYDDFDPYFVVAADKGTSTFSDLANRIAIEEYDYWLGDAFASGGSNGYDHKLYGITAKGAWECVKRHFSDLGLDHQASTFTAVGIGDMSGDVFGNGLLLSKNIKLLGAFDHRHVFVDPNPEPETSFQERWRLFQTPRSQWSDYNSKLISKGGGVYKRLEKEIPLSPELRNALSIPDEIPNVVNGEQLISLILKAKVDLLWNGGIGTYVKSRSESNADVSDGSNDNVRINANELRARVVGEGGNLGFTQKARVEYASRGGRSNTDAIDNSGGVDLSDHEVNLKIFFSGLLRDKKITLEERNGLLKEMAAPITQAVLEHNRNHALVLTLGATRSTRRLDYFKSLIGEIHRRGFVDRQLEGLPDDEELNARAKRGDGLYRPELAVCLAGVKLWVKSELLKSDLLNDPVLKEHLMAYFPAILRERFPKELNDHPLWRNITATQVTNFLVDLVGISFVHRMCLTCAATVTSVVKSALAADQIMRASLVREESFCFDNFKETKYLMQASQDLSGAHRFLTYWLISTHGDSHSLGGLVKLYKDRYQDVCQQLSNLLQKDERESFENRYHEYSSLGMSHDAATQLAIAPLIALVLEGLWIAGQARVDLNQVFERWYQVARFLKLTTVLRMEPGVMPSGRWEKELMVSSYQDLRRLLSEIVVSSLKTESLEAWQTPIKGSPALLQLHQTIGEVRLKVAEVAAFPVLAKQLRVFQAGI